MSSAGDPNKVDHTAVVLICLQVYEISMSTVIKMECDDCTVGEHLEEVGELVELREKVEFEHAEKAVSVHREEAALSALFHEFGSAR